jgi:hypothetical protein
LLALAYVAPDIETYFKNRMTLVASEKKIEQLREQDDIYISKILMLERDPGLIRRYHDKTFHVETDEPKYPKPDKATIKMAMDALRDVQEENDTPNKAPALAWLTVANRQSNRTLLYVAGGVLIATAIFFLNGIRCPRAVKNEIQESTA